MPRYQLTIAYDGTGFHGWQRQTLPADGVHAQDHIRRGHAHDLDGQGRLHLRTVQETVERAVRAVVREDVELIGASRTDSGVHARGQVAAFSCEPRSEELVPVLGVGEGVVEGAEGGLEGTEHTGGTPVPLGELSTGGTPVPSAAPAPRTGWPLARGAERLAAAINSRLPGDVLVVSAAAVPHRFDPVFGAVRKAYSYTYHVGMARPLWDRAFVHHVRRAGGFDLAAANEAAAVLVGEHDFAAFAAAGHGRLTTVRTVFACGVEERPGEAARVEHEPARRYRLHIEGSGFLWNMVRIIAGTLMQVGLGQKTPADVRAALESRDRRRAGPTIGPEGLCLEWIRYGGEAG